MSGGECAGGAGDRRDQQLQSQRLRQAWFPKGTVPPDPLPLHPVSYETGCVWVRQVLLPRTNGQKTEKRSTTRFKTDSFLWRQPQRVQLSCLSSGRCSVQQERRFFEGLLTVLLGSKHLSTVALGGLCIERAVRRET